MRKKYKFGIGLVLVLSLSSAVYSNSDSLLPVFSRHLSSSFLQLLTTRQRLNFLQAGGSIFPRSDSKQRYPASNGPEDSNQGRASALGAGSLKHRLSTSKFAGGFLRTNGAQLTKGKPGRIPRTFDCMKNALLAPKPNIFLRLCGLNDLLGTVPGDQASSPEETRRDIQSDYWSYMAAAEDGNEIWKQTIEAIVSQSNSEDQAIIACEFLQIYPEQFANFRTALTARGITAANGCVLGQSEFQPIRPSLSVSTSSDPNLGSPLPEPSVDCADDDWNCWGAFAHLILDGKSPPIGGDESSATASPSPSPSPSPTPAPGASYHLRCFPANVQSPSVILEADLGDPVPVLNNQLLLTGKITFSPLNSKYVSTASFNPVISVIASGIPWGLWQPFTDIYQGENALTVNQVWNADGKAVQNYLLQNGITDANVWPTVEPDYLTGTFQLLYSSWYSKSSGSQASSVVCFVQSK